MPRLQLYLQINECAKDKACKNKVLSAAKKAGKLIGELPGEHEHDHLEAIIRKRVSVMLSLKLS